MKKTDHPLYCTWKSMRKRCMSKSGSTFPYYKSRGISICKEWDDFYQFASDMGPKPPSHTLDRIDNNGNSCKENCRWATYKQQQRNTRWNRWITFRGETQCLSEWAIRAGVLPSAIAHRITKRGIERCLEGLDL